MPLSTAACPASSHRPAGAAQECQNQRVLGTGAGHGARGHLTACPGVLALSAMTGPLKKPRVRRKWLYHSVCLRAEEVDKELSQAQSDYPGAFFYK